jgi:NAD(P) transhydrogenase subunit alpha
MGKGDKFKIDMNDAVISRAMVTHDGKINWPPAPLPVTAAKATTAAAVVAADPKEAEAKKSRQQSLSMLIRLVVIGGFLGIIGQFAPSDFVQHFTVFVLSVFVGWQLIWNVSHSLHTPLMALTNAISGIILVGGLIQVGSLADPLAHLPITILATVAILVASINIVGGFVVTHRMLKMFKK